MREKERKRGGMKKVAFAVHVSKALRIMFTTFGSVF